MISTTGSSLENYLAWLKGEVEKRDYGEVSLKIKVERGQIVGAEKSSLDKEIFPLKPIDR